MRRFSLLALCIVAAGTLHAEVELKDGDILFHTSRSNQSIAIQHATKSIYSHLGMIFHRGGKPCVFEAAGTVTCTPLESWIARGEGGHYAVKRLADPKILNRKAKARLREEAGLLEGKSYDYTFAWSDERMYCSEVVWKIYERALEIEIGKLQRLKEFDLSDPIVKAKIQERYGSHPPLEETVISPQSIFDSPLLVTVDKK